VYGALADLALDVRRGRYAPSDELLDKVGIDEGRPLDFYSPYGCSKGCADQYVLDHARMYGIRAAVFRMSCIYGPHQCGTEDQGWLAHFMLRALARRPITIYGDGMQVRDVLHVADLVEAMERVRSKLADAPEEIAGQAFNVGGGPRNAVSLLEIVDRIAARVGYRPLLEFAPWRPGDQRYYVTDSGKLRQATGWAPGIGIDRGVSELAEALRAPRADGVAMLDSAAASEQRTP
jgi:CDP-paratose 2-epimerase